MRTLLPMVAAVTLLVAITPATSTFAADDAKAKKPKTKRLMGYWAIVAPALKLTEAQKTKYTEAALAKSAATKKWAQDHESEISELKAAVKKAKADKDKDAASKAGKKLKALYAERNALDDKHRAAIENVLTDKQKDTLAGYSLYMGASLKYRKAGLAEDQKAKMKELCMSHGGDARAAANDKAATNKVKDKLAAAIESKILTAEQREKITAGKTKKPKK